MAQQRFDSARLEQLVGGKALNLAGLLLVFLGTGFFLKVAFDHDWIAPPERVALGLIAGAALIVYAQFRARRDARYFGEGLTALGAAIEFLSLYAAGPSYFDLVPAGGAFAGMIVTSTALAVLGWYHRSERLGVLAAVAGFLAPAIIGAPQTGEWMLASYLVVLAAALLVLGELLDSAFLAPLALLGTLCYAVGHFYGAPLAPLERVEIFGAFYLTFAASVWVVGKLRSGLDPVRIAIATIALGAFAVALYGQLYPVDRTLVGEIMFALAAVHAVAAGLTRARYQGWLAALMLTLAIPTAYGGAALAAGWSLEALALVCAGVAFKDDVLRIGGLLLTGLTFLDVLAANLGYQAHLPFWNQRFVSLAALVAAIAGSDLALSLKPFRNADDAVLSRVLRVGGHAIALWMFGAEAADLAGGYVSIVWTVFAAGLLWMGVRKRDAFTRWEGLVLMIAAVAKVLTVDLSSLAIEYRVLCGVVVGIILIVVSYGYQRRARAAAADAESAT